MLSETQYWAIQSVTVQESFHMFYHKQQMLKCQT